MNSGSTNQSPIKNQLVWFWKKWTFEEILLGIIVFLKKTALGKVDKGRYSTSFFVFYICQILENSYSAIRKICDELKAGPWISFNLRSSQKLDDNVRYMQQLHSRYSLVRGFPSPRESNSASRSLLATSLSLSLSLSLRSTRPLWDLISRRCYITLYVRISFVQWAQVKGLLELHLVQRARYNRCSWSRGPFARSLYLCPLRALYGIFAIDSIAYGSTSEWPWFSFARLLFWVTDKMGQNVIWMKLLQLIHIYWPIKIFSVLL